MQRTRFCGEFRRCHIGQVATVMGWVLTRRDMGGVIFLDLRDREGTLQTVFDRSLADGAAFALAERVTNQSVVMIAGETRLRDETTYNALLPTGEVELAAKTMILLSPADPLPFPLDTAQIAREDIRLKYRYLDLRRPEMYAALRFRAKLIREATALLDEKGLLPVETPVLCLSTPEGARDYLVPSRVHPGSFYALPQSPQIYKQLLMVGGVDGYYQVARCFRDEDLRADRQPEFTQVDMERSFVDQEDMLSFLQGYFTRLYERATGKPLALPFRRMTWQEAMDVYGSDKPDLRFELPIVDVSDVAAKTSFSVFLGALKKGGVVRAINLKRAEGALTRASVDNLTKVATDAGAKGMAWIWYKQSGEISSILTKYFSPDTLRALETRLDIEKGDLIVFCADELETARAVTGRLRLAAAKLLSLVDGDAYQFALITDFPMFEYKKEERRYAAMHHPFTMPNLDDLDKMRDDKANVRSQAYDVVLNGVELGSGSVRIHRRDVQQRVFSALGFSEGEAQRRFGFLLEAFRYGTPPHAGFAFGVDRLCMLLLKAESIREVIAFPKTKDASCLMTGAPAKVDGEQLAALRFYGKEDTRVDRQKSRETVEKTAALAMLTLSEDEKAALTDEFAQLVAFAGELGQATAPAPEKPPAGGGLRADEPQEGLAVEQMLQNAPSARGRYIAVPRAVEKGEADA